VTEPVRERDRISRRGERRRELLDLLDMAVNRDPEVSLLIEGEACREGATKTSHREELGEARGSRLLSSSKGAVVDRTEL